MNSNNPYLEIKYLTNDYLKLNIPCNSKYLESELQPSTAD